MEKSNHENITLRKDQQPKIQTSKNRRENFTREKTPRDNFVSYPQLFSWIMYSFVVLAHQFGVYYRMGTALLFILCIFANKGNVNLIV